MNLSLRNLVYQANIIYAHGHNAKVGQHFCDFFYSNEAFPVIFVCVCVHSLMNEDNIGICIKP